MSEMLLHFNQYLSAKLILGFQGTSSSYFVWEDFRLHVWLNQNLGVYQIDLKDLETEETVSGTTGFADAVSACDAVAGMAVNAFVKKISKAVETINEKRQQNNSF